MNGNYAAGPDGFNGNFYIYSWNIIKLDLLEAVKELFCGFELPKSSTSTLIVPIPKIDIPTEFKHLRSHQPLQFLLTK